LLEDIESGEVPYIRLNIKGTGRRAWWRFGTIAKGWNDKLLNSIPAGGNNDDNRN
jgi:hypothetical protein